MNSKKTEFQIREKEKKEEEKIKNIREVAVDASQEDLNKLLGKFGRNNDTSLITKKKRK